MHLRMRSAFISNKLLCETWTPQSNDFMRKEGLKNDIPRPCSRNGGARKMRRGGLRAVSNGISAVYRWNCKQIRPAMYRGLAQEQWMP